MFEVMYLRILVVAAATAIGATPLATLDRSDNTTTITTTSNHDDWSIGHPSLAGAIRETVSSEAATMSSTESQLLPRDEINGLTRAETNALLGLIIVALILEIALLASNVPSILEWWTNERARRRSARNHRDAERQRAADILASHPLPRDDSGSGVEGQTIELGVLRAHNAGQWPLNNHSRHGATASIGTSASNGNGNGNNNDAAQTQIEGQTHIQTQVQFPFPEQEHRRPDTPRTSSAAGAAAGTITAAGYALRERESYRSMNFSRVSRPPTAGSGTIRNHSNNNNNNNNNSGRGSSLGGGGGGGGQDITEAARGLQERPSVGPDDLQSLLSAARMPEPQHGFEFETENGVSQRGGGGGGEASSLESAHQIYHSREDQQNQGLGVALENPVYYGGGLGGGGGGGAGGGDGARQSGGGGGGSGGGAGSGRYGNVHVKDWAYDGL